MLVGSHGIRLNVAGDLRVQLSLGIAHWLEGVSITVDFSQTVCGSSILFVHEAEGLDQAFVAAQGGGMFQFVLGAAPSRPCTAMSTCRVGFDILFSAVCEERASLSPTTSCPTAPDGAAASTYPKDVAASAAIQVATSPATGEKRLPEEQHMNDPGLLSRMVDAQLLRGSCPIAVAYSAYQTQRGDLKWIAPRVHVATWAAGDTRPACLPLHLLVIHHIVNTVEAIMTQPPAHFFGPGAAHSIQPTTSALSSEGN